MKVKIEVISREGLTSSGPQTFLLIYENGIWDDELWTELEALKKYPVKDYHWEWIVDEGPN